MDTPQRKRDIFSIVGLPPEVLAVAMAKYSRSSKSIRETINELTEEKSAEFHEKWVLGYGDASVADMAVVAMAVENVSILASKVIQDNRIASYQEKSTRYVQFDSSSYYSPANIMSSKHSDLYVTTADMLFATYERVLQRMIEYYREHYPKLAEMKDKLYEARLKARALDVARYLLPAATLTNFGMIMSARSLRHAISKMKGHPLQEVREIAEEVQAAAVNPAYNPQKAKVEPLLETLTEKAPDEAVTLNQVLSLQIKGAPTLVKFTEPKEYFDAVTSVGSRFARELGLDSPRHADEPRLDYLAERIEPEDELVATIIYSGSNKSFREILKRVQDLPETKKREIIAAVQSKRGERDWLTRHFEVPGSLIFDTLFDYGAFRDLQRHRLTTQINQPLGVEHGYEIPRDLEEAGLLTIYRNAMHEAEQAVRELQKDFSEESRYLIPLGFRKRTLFKMNLREFHHFVELRSKSGGHFSYRSLVYDMYEQVKKVHPLLVEHLRAVKMDFKADFYKR
ncbi:MAG: FAD-dependent thymidylate synthase [Candidatus Kerfeldbacteria bacterium]|nr:FAD-dependent thymidylate synthase [Candidatus Kerfeldbacteria bacterium]